MVKRLLFLAIALCMLLISASLVAQPYGGSVFLQGDHLEVGISDCGTYGTPIAPPASGSAGTAYHPTEPGLGFVADANLDGWTVGSPQYCGDFFLPGSPVEGFGLSINGNIYLNTNGFGVCAVMEVPGSNTTYSDLGDTVLSVWEGTHPDGFDLSIKTAIPKGKRYFTGTVTIANTSTTDLNDIYFVRQLDPDNDQPWGGGYVTTNEIVSQPGIGSTDALVTANGTMGCFLGLGARHYASRASKGGFFIIGPEDTYCGTGPFVLDGMSTADEAIAISFFFDRIVPGDQVSFSYAYILSEDELDEALEATAAPALTANGLNLPLASDTIGENHYLLTSCPGDTHELALFGANNYDWDWTPQPGLSNLTGHQATLIADGPSTYTLSAPLPCGDPLIVTLTVEMEALDWFNSLVGDTAVCPGNSIQLADDPGSTVSVSWTPVEGLDDANIPNPTFVAAEPGTTTTYTYIATNANGCEIVDSLQLTVFPNPEITVCGDKYINAGGTTQLSATGGLSYHWSPAVWLSGEESAVPYAFPPATTTFTVVAEDINGCFGTETVTVNVLGATESIIMPNAFSPNGDGLNDIFRPKVNPGAELIDLQIFNRWGQLVFRSDNASRGWDGTFMGVAQEMGTFTVIASVEREDGDVENKTVSLTLVR